MNCRAWRGIRDRAALTTPAYGEIWLRSALQGLDNQVGHGAAGGRVLSCDHATICDGECFPGLLRLSVGGASFLQFRLGYERDVLIELARRSSSSENPVTCLPIFSSVPSDRVMFSKPTAPWQTDETIPPFS